MMLLPAAAPTSVSTSAPCPCSLSAPSLARPRSFSMLPAGVRVAGGEGAENTISVLMARYLHRLSPVHARVQGRILPPVLPAAV